MKESALTLSVALSSNERTRPVIEGRFQPQGVNLIPTVVHPSEMFWRQLRFGDFDISEMSLSSLLINIARGDKRWVALPVFTVRRFFHTSILVRRDRHIATPKDLCGRRVGVPEYQQTWAVWSRGILEHEFGVDPREIEWFMERGPDRSHAGARGFSPPSGIKVNQIPASTNIGEMMIRGEIDATLLYLNEANLVDRAKVDLATESGIGLLFSDPQSESSRYYRKTGIYPINHTLVIRRELLERHPWLAINIYHAFLAAKRSVERDMLASLQPFLATGVMASPAGDWLAIDPAPYGIQQSRKVLEMLAQYVYEQGLCERAVSLEEVFAASTLGL